MFFMNVTRISGRTVTGGLILLVGLLLLLGTTNTYDTGELWRFFPTVFVVIALWSMAQSGLRNLTWPLVVLIVAGAWQLAVLDVVTDATIETWWPLVLVAIGIAIILGRTVHRVPVTAGDTFDIFTAFGGVERRVTSPAFRKGEVTAVFGGADVDLRDADLEDGPATINVLTLFGGTDIKLPEDWTVQVDVLPIFASSEDERPRRGGPSRGDPDLIVTGAVAFGGVSIKD
ncbi:MAG: hypothetical protein ACI9YT_000980 [Halobacteriales archaeon]|jgi:hypothetical protein